MINIDGSVPPSPQYLTFDLLPTGLSDSNASDLDRLAASLDGLTLSCRESGADEAPSILSVVP